jgi:hypothetical protein
MRPLLVVVLEKFARQQVEMVLAECDELVETLVLDGLNEAVVAGVVTWHAVR